MQLKNTYYLMRHGQAISNVKRLCSCRPEKFKNPLTEYGREMARESVEKLKIKLDNEGHVMDLIFCSPLLRTVMTAKIAGGILAIALKTDVRLREAGFGIFNGKPLEGMWRYFKRETDRIKKASPNGESYEDILARMLKFIDSVEKKYKDRNILIVSHECPLFLLQGKAMGMSILETIANFPNEKRIHKAEIRKLN